MKKIMITLGVLILSAGFTFAQRYAFVDTEYILSNIPSYKASQDKLDQFSKEWEKEISDEYAEGKERRSNYW